MAVGVKHRQVKRKPQKPVQHRTVSEIIGRGVVENAQMSLYRNRANVTTVDATIPDYGFWDRVRRGKEHGFTLGALFARPIEQIYASWTFGRGVTVKLAESGNPEDDNDPRNYTDGLIADFINEYLTTLIEVEEDKLGLGNQFPTVNIDGSLSIPSPDTVTVERDPIDYKTVIAYTITIKLPDGRTVTDRYTDTERTVTIKQGDKVESQQTYQNLIGRIPVIHAAYGMRRNEVYGHPIHEPLRNLYDEYDNIVYKQIDGARMLGNPLFAVTGLEDLSAVEDMNQPSTTSTYYDKDGALTNRPQIKIDQNAALLIGKGGDAKFVSPPVGFTQDTQNALQTLFWLMLQHSQIPEFVWGTQLDGAHATTQVQMTQWVRNIEGKRRENEKWLLELCEIWLATMALTDSQIVVDKLVADWPELVEEDEKTRLDYVKYAHDSGLLTDKTALEILDLVDDPAEETQEAQDERQARQDAMFPDGIAPTNTDTMPMDTQTQPAQPVRQMVDNQPPAYIVQTLLDFKAKLLELN